MDKNNSGPPRPNGSLYTDKNQGKVPTPNGSLYTGVVNKPLPTPSFNRAVPTARGGLLQPLWVSRMYSPAIGPYHPDTKTEFSPTGIKALLEQKEPDWNGYQVDQVREYCPPKTIDDPGIRAMAGEYMYHRLKMAQERAKLKVAPSWIATLGLIIEKGPVRYEDLDIRPKIAVAYLQHFDLITFICTKEDQSGRLLACTGYGMAVYNAYQKEHPST